ncbi:MAG: RNA degradosome polyphosphate kinase, partial [Acetatifactor sp.]|nr:RNA degradosome polyphosphate kinase [Acetatifactor sp.]
DNEEFYCGSADWMPRNLERRVEILFPVEEPALREQLRDILNAQLKDNVKAHVLQPDGTYVKVNRRGRERFISQEYFCSQAQRAAKEAAGEPLSETRRFVPETHR